MTIPHNSAPALHQSPDELLETCRQMVSRHRGLVPGADEEDLVQEAAMAAIKAARNFDPAKSKAATFTWTAAHRRMIDLYRLRKNKPINESMPENTESGTTFSDDIFSIVDRALFAAEDKLGGRKGQGRVFPLYQLAACLIVRTQMRQSHRSFQMMLATSSALCERLGLHQIPCRMTLHYAARSIRRITRMKRCAQKARNLQLQSMRP